MEQQTATHVWVSELLSGSFVQKEDEPSSVLIKNRTIYKARLYGTVVSTEELVIDDGTGSIIVRTFDTIHKVEIGDTVIVIGRPRLHNQEAYILGEIVKKIDKKWFELREKQHPKPITDQHDLALETVRFLDKGGGADYNELITKFGEELITHLITTGELYETRPGKLKILE